MDHSREFLKLLIMDNAINYAQDKKTKSWMAGYYVNNAFFRIEEVIDRFDSDRGVDPECCAPFNEFKKAVREAVASTDRPGACDSALAAAKEALLKLRATGAPAKTEGT